MNYIDENVLIGQNVKLGDNVTIKAGCILEDNIIIGDNVFVDCTTIIHSNVIIESDSTIGARCILGEYVVDFYEDRVNKIHPLHIGRGSLIRSESIIYGDNDFGDYLQTGHRVTIREKSQIGEHVRIGTLSDIQGYCKIGNYVQMHSNVHIGQESVIKDYVMIFPYVVLTNDPYPPSRPLHGVTIEEFAVICTGAVLLPGVIVKKDALVGAGAIVSKDVASENIAVGNPAKMVGNVTKILNKDTGEQVYPWRYSYGTGMPWAGIGYETWRSKKD